MARLDMNPRTCVATRSEKSPEEMLRFVLDGEDRVVPDLQRKLPGRGVWVTVGQNHLKDVIEKSQFARAFKKQVTVEEDLVGLVDQLMVATVTGLLSIARKAGMLVPGRANIEREISNGSLAVLLHAEGTDGDGRKKLDRLVQKVEHKPAIFELIEGQSLDQISGVGNTAHLGVLDSGIADKIVGALAKLERFRSS